MIAIRSLLPRVATIQQLSQFSTSSRLNISKEWGTPLHRTNFSVPSFGGSVAVKSPIDVWVKPMGNFENPNLDSSSVKLYSKDGHSAIVTDSDLEGRTEITTSQQGACLNVEGKAGTSPGNDALVVEAPVVHNVSVASFDDANVEVSDFIECDYCQVTADTGSVQVQRIKTAALNITTNSGEIFCSGHIQGAVKISSVTGAVVADQRFIGPSLDISTDSGDIRVASSYSDQSKFVTNRGNINLRNIHNESYIASYECGDVKVKGIDGSTNVFVKKGDLEIHISKINHESRILVEEGDITVKMIDTHPLKLTVDANHIIPDTKFAKLGKLENRKGLPTTMHYSASIHPNVFSPALTIIAENGNVILESQDWAASLGLKMATPKYKKDELQL